MPHLTTTLLLPLLTLLPPALTSGIPLVVSPGLNISTTPNITAHLPACTTLIHAPTIPCYTTLNTTSYLQNYNLTSAEVCAPTELWSTCLLRSVYQVPGTNCTATSNTTSSCLPFDCAHLNSTTCVQPMTTNQTDVTKIQAQGWYAVWNVYAVHHHVSAWATALDRKSSEPAILGAVKPRVANTATSVLKTLLPKYGFNGKADGAIVKLLGEDGQGMTMGYGNPRVRGESKVLSGADWRGLLVERLEEVLEVANGEFGDWLGMVEGGAYSTRGLSGVDALVRSLKKGG